MENRDIETARLELERTRLGLEREKLKLENEKSSDKKSALERYAPLVWPILTAIVGGLFGALQWRAAERDEQTKLAVAQIAHSVDVNLQLLNFLTSQREQIFSDDPKVAGQMATFIRVLFPEQYQSLFPELVKSAPTASKAEYVSRQNVAPTFQTSAAVVETKPAVDEQNCSSAPPLSTHVTVTAVSASQGSYTFSLSLDPSPDTQGVQRVDYYFDHPSFTHKLLSATDSSKRFTVGYTGWGALDAVCVTAFYADGSMRQKSVDMLAELKW